jgi:hypothetical protein
VVEKEREKDLGKVVTGGGRARRRQTTEDTEDTQKSKPQRTRRTRRITNHGEHGGGKEGADTLVRPYMARHWVVRRAVGQGAQGRLESRPQARKPAPHHGGQECQRHTRRLLVSRGGKSSQADHRQDCRCGTQDCVLHAEAGMASLAACSTEGPVGQARGRTHWSAPTRQSIELIRGRWGKGPRPTGMLGAGLEACPSEGG